MVAFFPLDCWLWFKDIDNVGVCFLATTSVVSFYFTF